MRGLIYFLAWFTVFLLLSEITLRTLGKYPWRTERLSTVLEPGAKLCRKDPQLGYTHLPGAFKITLKNKHVFNVTHTKDTLRITHPINTYDDAAVKPEIWIFGCSITHGWSINDEETYPYILNSELQGYEIVNYGVSGYGTIQALIQFKEALKTKKARLAIIAYGSFHDERNTFSRKARKTIAPWNKLGVLSQPYARLDRNKNLRYGMARIEYREFPLMRYSSLMNLIEEKYNTIEGRIYQNHEVSKAIIKEIAMLCKKNDVSLLVAGISSDCRTSEMLEFCKREGIPAADISVDYSLAENNNLPIDGHPSALANKKIADKLYSFLIHNQTDLL